MTDVSKLKSPKDLGGLDYDELRNLAAQMREVILKYVSTHGGHVGPNLGVVEATLALYRVFDMPTDKLVWDVSHQDLAHKIVTGRVGLLLDPAGYDSFSEYTDPEESPEYDLFYGGHTSPSITLCAGLMKARDLRGEKYNVIAFIGDGSLSGGVAFEGLDAAGALGTNLIVVVNDNGMAIAEDHGSIYDNLRLLRETNGTADNNYFRSLGFDYRYVSEGNDVRALEEVFRSVRDIGHPVVVHINTQKGEGYAPAERELEKFHWMMPFNVADGEADNNTPETDYAGETERILSDMMDADSTLAVLTAATPGIFGFTPDKREKHGGQFWDVGIAEQCAVSAASGIVKGGAKAVFAVEATFLQRAYDQLVEDLSLDRLPAVLLIFGAGVFGIPDVTHLGLWDMAMLSNIPGLQYLGPTNLEEYESMLRWAVAQGRHPVAIRVPTISVTHAEEAVPTEYDDLNSWQVTRHGKDVVIIGASNMYHLALKTADMLKSEGVGATVVKPVYLSGVDEKLLDRLTADHRVFVTIEDSSVEGGLGEKVARVLGPADVRVKCYGLKKEFIDRYNPTEVLAANGITPGGIAADVLAMMKR